MRYLKKLPDFQVSVQLWTTLTVTSQRFCKQSYKFNVFKKSPQQSPLNSHFWPTNCINQPRQALLKTDTFTALSQQTREIPATKAAPLQASRKITVFINAEDTEMRHKPQTRHWKDYQVFLPSPSPSSLAVKGCLLLELALHFHTSALHPWELPENKALQLWEEMIAAKLRSLVMNSREDKNGVMVSSRCLLIQVGT